MHTIHYHQNQNSSIKEHYWPIHTFVISSMQNHNFWHPYSLFSLCSAKSFSRVTWRPVCPRDCRLSIICLQNQNSQDNVYRYHHSVYLMKSSPTSLRNNVLRYLCVEHGRPGVKTGLVKTEVSNLLFSFSWSKMNSIPSIYYFFLIVINKNSYLGSCLQNINEQTIPNPTHKVRTYMYNTSQHVTGCTTWDAFYCWQTTRHSRWVAL